MTWLRAQMTVLDVAGAVAAFAANWLLQSTLLIAAGLLIAWLARRRGAAAQSAIYRTTLAAVIVCPLATLILSLNGVSGWSLPMPATWHYEEVTSPLVEDTGTPDVAVAPTQASAPLASDADGAIRVGGDKRVERAPAHHAQNWHVAQPPSAVAAAARHQSQPRAAVPHSQPARHRGAEARKLAVFQIRHFGFAAIGISIAWLLGTALLLVRLAFAWHRLHRLIVAATPADSAVQEACRQAASLVGVAAPRVLSSPYLASPCLAYLWCGRLARYLEGRRDACTTMQGRRDACTTMPRAAVLLPEVTAALPLRDVLVHELAHLRRGDAGWNLIARLTEALLFYQPLVWFLNRRLEASAEEVCDDYVVQFGGDRSQYARGLLEIAELATTPVAAPAVAMVSLRSILARRVTRIMDSSRSLSTRAGNLLLALVIVGGLTAATVVGFVGLAPQAPAEAEPLFGFVTDDDAEASATNAQPQGPRKPAAVSAVATSDDDLVTVSGTVVDPQGKPFAGAKLYAVRWYWEPHIPHPPLAETTSDGEGRFTISYRKSQFTVDVARGDQWKEVSIVATADEFGPGWVTWRDIPYGRQPTLRLVTDDAPIVARVVDLEGKPVAGVAVRVESIHTGKGGNLDGWLEAVRRGEFPWTAAKHLDDDLPQFDGWPPRVVTDGDGRFRLHGLGRERRIDLSFSGPTIAYQEVEVVTRRSDMFPLKSSRSEKEVDMVYGAEFELVAPPTQPITGIVRDAETRQPLAGVSIESNMFAGSSFTNTRQLRAVSDEQGRYLLVGMPKGAGNRVLAVPNDDQPYLMQDVKVPESRGLEPVSLDIDLHRGIWITGRITDLRTGEPLVARLHYLPFLSNEYAQKTPEFGDTASADSWGFQERYVSRPDGSYRLVGLPGHAIVGAECVLGPYRKGVGADRIAGMNEHGHFKTYLNPVDPGKKWPHAMKEINPAPGTAEVVCDLALDPGEKVTVNVLDPDGKPLDGFETQGSGAAWSDSPEFHSHFDVITLGPEEPRTVIIRHKERKLGKVIRVKLADHPSRSCFITLEPTGRIIGRLVDRQGSPISGAAIEACVLPMGDFSARLPATATDEQGRFEYTDIPVGCHYTLNAEAAGMKMPGWFARDVAIEPGETKDLAHVVYGSAAKGGKDVDPKQENQEPADGADKDSASTKPANEKTVRGRVLLPDGKPAGGAHLAVIGYRNAVARGGEFESSYEVLAEGTAGEEGDYVLRMRGVSQQTYAWAHVVARQDGSAVAWRDLNLDAAEMRADLKLSPEKPLRGKLVDLEGQPAAGVRMSIATIYEPAEKEQETEAAGYRPTDRVPAAWIAPITSDEQGRFLVYGLAANQGVTFEVAGDDRFAHQNILLNSGLPEKRGETDATYRPLVKNARPEEEAMFALAPAKVFQGTVRYADTGAAVPHARVSIWASQEFRSMMSTAVSANEQGRYRITPYPGIRFGVSAYPPSGTPYLVRKTPRDKAIHWEGGERVKQVDMTLPRGVLVRGRVVEAVSGAPVAGAAVQYMPESSNNPNASDDILTGWQAIEVTDRDGRFTVAVLPGPGRLLVNGPYGKYVFQEIGDRELSSGKPGGTRNYVHAVAKLDPQAGQAALDVKLELQPGATARGRIIDETGQPVDQALVISRLNISPYSLFWRGHTTPTLGGRFELTGLAEGTEYPVYFLDPKRRLGATAILKAGEKERRVVLKPCGKATLRLVDRKGVPLPANYANVDMVVTPGPHRFDGEARERGELAADADFISNVDRLNNPLTADENESGLVTLQALIPGATYRVSELRGGEFHIVKEFQVQPNETVELGEMIVERE